MSKFLQVFLALTLCASTNVYSWGDIESGECCDTAIRSDTSKSGFYVGATGVWAVPSETGLGTFTDSWQYANPDESVTALSKPSKARYKGAGGGKIGYDAPCSGNNFELEYFYLHNSKHNVNDTSDGPISFGSAFFDLGIPLTPGAVFVSDSHLKYTLNQLDAKAGHHIVAAGGNLKLLPFIGARFLELKHDLTFLVGHVRSTYSGAGPLAGLDGEYLFCNGFSFTGRFDGAVLMGSVKANSLLDFGVVNRYKSPKTDRIAYSVSGRLGVAYEYELCNQSSFKIEAGYKVANYHGPFDIISAIVTPVPRIGNLGTTNFGYSGPYLEMSWHM